MPEFDPIDPVRMAQVQRELHQEDALRLRDAKVRLLAAQDAADIAANRERRARPEFHSWRMIDSPLGSATTRMEVPGGWIYKHTPYVDGVAGAPVIVFVPRPAGE